MKVNTLETVSGQLVNIENPEPDTILIDDIAWGISRLNRFAGHTITAIPPTVAQHSIFVSDLLMRETNDKALGMIGLLHDSGEVYTSDVPSPVKRIEKVGDVIKKIENNFLAIIYDKFLGRQPTTQEWEICHIADKKAQFIEAYHFMHSRGLHWQGRSQCVISLKELHDYPTILTSIQSYELFIDRFNSLKP